MAGVLFSSDVSGVSPGAKLPNWFAAGGAGLVAFTSPAGGYAPSPNAQGYGNASAGDADIYKGSGILGDQAMRCSVVVGAASGFSSVGSMRPMVRASVDSIARYHAQITSDGTTFGLTLVKYNNGAATLNAATGAVNLGSGGGTLEIEIKAVGSTIEGRLWVRGGAYPTAPTVTATDSSYTTGYPGLIQGGNFGYLLAGNIVVTDTTVSSGVFDPVADTTPPTVASASVANSTPTIVALTMSETMDTISAAIPAASAFTVSGHTVSSVAISGNTISLTVSAAFVNGEAARTVAYTQPGTNNARDVAGNLLGNFTAQAITNNVAAADVTAPALSTAQVLNSAPTQIVLTFNETLGALTPAASAFAVSGGKTVSSVARSGAQITLTCSAAYAFGDSITVTYTKPGTNPIQDAAANQTNSFGPSAVTNNVASGNNTVTITATDKNTGLPATGKKSADGALRISVPCNVVAMNMNVSPPTVVEHKTGIMSPSSGPFTYTSTVLTTGVERFFIVRADANGYDLGTFWATPV